MIRNRHCLERHLPAGGRLICLACGIAVLLTAASVSSASAKTIQPPKVTVAFAQHAANVAAAKEAISAYQYVSVSPGGTLTFTSSAEQVAQVYPCTRARQMNKYGPFFDCFARWTHSVTTDSTSPYGPPSSQTQTANPCDVLEVGALHRKYEPPLMEDLMTAPGQTWTVPPQKDLSVDVRLNKHWLARVTRFTPLGFGALPPECFAT